MTVGGNSSRRDCSAGRSPAMKRRGPRLSLCRVDLKFGAPGTASWSRVADDWPKGCEKPGITKQAL